MKGFRYKYFLFFVISPLLVGLGTYLVARPPESYILGKMFNFKQSRFIEMIQIPIKYDWMKHNLADALWMFSFCSLNISIWGVKIFGDYLLLTIILLLGLSIEFMQFINVMPGTYDVFLMSLILYG